MDHLPIAAYRLLPLFVAGTCAFADTQLPVVSPQETHLTSPVLAPQLDATPVPQVQRKVFACNPGPWGDLEYYYVNLEPPDWVVDSLVLHSWPPVWRFVDTPPESVLKIFQDANLPPDIHAKLVDQSKWRRINDDICIYPSEDTILGLPEFGRLKINVSLSNWPENAANTQFTSQYSSVNEWFADADLSPEVMARLQAVTVHTTFGLQLWDAEFPLAAVKDSEERSRLLRALFRQRALILRLKISDHSNIQELHEYWSTAAGQKEVPPILEAVSMTTGVEHLDIIHLLPPTPRKFLNTFPNMRDGLFGRWRDCFWSATTFLSSAYPDDDDILRPRFISYLNGQYEPTQEPYRFGDMLVLSDPITGEVLHACTFIADDIVYTKNGATPRTPWVLMKLAEVHRQYAMFQEDGLRVSAYRPSMTPPQATGPPPPFAGP